MVDDDHGATDSPTQDEKRQGRNGHGCAGPPIDNREQDQTLNDPDNSRYSFHDGRLERLGNGVDIAGVTVDNRGSRQPALA